MWFSLRWLNISLDLIDFLLCSFGQKSGWWHYSSNGLFLVTEAPRRLTAAVKRHFHVTRFRLRGTSLGFQDGKLNATPTADKARVWVMGGRGRCLRIHISPTHDPSVARQCHYRQSKLLTLSYSRVFLFLCESKGLSLASTTWIQ